MRQMTHYKTVRDTPVLVDNQEVGHIVSSASIHQLLELVGSSVKSLCSRKYKSEFFGKLLQLSRGISRCCDHDFRILHTCPSVLVILTACYGSAPCATLGKCQLRACIIPC